MSGTLLPFAKMHGCGNDYVVVEAGANEVPDPAALAREMSDRRTGVGSDGLILALPSDVADIRMRMFNVDGTEAEMCGNGLRCLARFAYEKGLVGERLHMRVETSAGILPVELRGLDGSYDAATVDMGTPSLDPASLPMRGVDEAQVDAPLALNGGAIRITAVSMGNPHVVTFVPDVDEAMVETIGPAVENLPAFPQRTNVAFVQVLAEDELRQRTWERGCGETPACGTGACAAVVAGALTERCGRSVTVHLRGGDLHVRWAEDDHVYLRGPAAYVFDGVWRRARP